MQRFDRLRLNRPTAASSRDVQSHPQANVGRQRVAGSLSTGDSIVKHLRTIAAAGFLATAILPAAAEDISGAGATFPYPIYAKWADAYKKETGVGLNYQSIGSGGGIKQIEARTVTFGATDAPLKGEELDKSGMVQFPMVMGGIVPVVNLDPGLQFPKQAIAVIHRSDGSGTNFNLTNYLSKVSPEWKTTVGSDTAVEWPVGIGAKGNEGVSANVAQTKGAIGYVEYAYAKQNKLLYTKMLNKDGKTVSPVLQAFQAAAANADWNSVPGYGVILSNQPGAASWPMTAATFILIPRQPPDPAAAAEALKFFDWAYSNGAKMAEELDYVPMPESVVASVRKVWTGQIKDAAGKPL